VKRTELRAGAKSLERGSTFKVPRHPMRKRRSRGRPAERLKAEMAEFKASVWNRVCASCGGRTYFGGCDAHHVVYKQHLPVELRWDPRNALPVCDDCHERHHNASRRIPLSALTAQNLEFAREVLGAAAGDYLERRYAA
jgi:hypothetical protein